MNLDNDWTWQKKKLSVRLRPETMNPAGDGLRETFTELAGIDLNDLLNEMKSTKKKKEQINKVLIDYEADKTFTEVLYRSRVLGATKIALDGMTQYDQEKSTSLTQKNVRKQFTLLPKSPPKRVVLEIQRERSKPLRLPDPEERAAATAKLEKKLAKQRAARMAAIEQSAMEATEQDMTTMEISKTFIEELGDTAKHCLKTYDGDQFSVAGPYLEGMLYLSRMADSSTKMKRKKDKELEQHLKRKADLDEEEMSRKQAEEEEASSRLTGTGMKEDSISTAPDINAKINCAMSLCNWSRNPQNASRLSSEGAVRAIMILSMEYNDRISVFCAAAFRHMSESYELAVSMIEEGAIATMSEVCSSRTDDFTLTNVAIALVNLTRVNGKEGQLVGEAAIVLALMNLIMLKSELGVVCVRGLYNLTCVDISYQFIERVIRALVSLSLSGTANVKHLCAASLCNLSDMKSVRPRMVEEGAINVLTSLSRGAETRTRRVCAVILQNLSAAKSIRVEMGSRNSVTAAYSLSSDQDPIILRCIGLTLSRLAMEPVNCQRIIQESGIAALCNIAVKYPTIPGISQPVASAFQLLSSHPEYRIIVASEGSVTAIAALLLSSVDMFTLQHSLLALCNLLCEFDNHTPIIQQGLIITLISMCDQGNDLIKDFCALAFLNLSCCEDSRKHIVNSGAIVAVIAITKDCTQVTMRRCAAILCNISYFTSGMNRMVSDGIIPAVVNLVLARDIETVHFSCASLCHLCCTVDNARLILESGAIGNVVRGALEGDLSTRQICGAVLSSLSFYEACRLTLVELGAINALKGLAKSADEVTKQRCLVAFANISCESSVHEKMVDDSVIEIIAQLANSNQEINFICCAKAMCNLACNEEKKFKVATEGGVHALLMICMVKSVDRLTKLLCIIGLNNLIDDTTIDFMLSQELIGSMTNISRIGDSNIANLCIRVFNRLSKYMEGKEKMCEKQATLSALLAMADSDIADTKTIATRTCLNILVDEEVRGAAITGGLIGSIEKCFAVEAVSFEESLGNISTLSELSSRHANQESSVQDGLIMQTLTTVFSLCSETVFREYMAKSRTPVILLRLIMEQGSSVEEYSLAIKALSLMAWDVRSRLFLQKKEIFTLFLYVIETNFKVLAAEWLAHCIRFLITDYDDNYTLVHELGLLGCMTKINERTVAKDDSGISICRSLVAALRTLCHDPSVPTIDLVSEGTMSILSNAYTLAAEDDKIMYDVGCVLYLFATESTECRQKTCLPDTIRVITALEEHSLCAELVAVAMTLYAGDLKCRSFFACRETIQSIVNVIDLKLVMESMNSNFILAIFAYAKFPAGRALLTDISSGFNIERTLTALNNHTSSKIKANINRAMKCINTDPNEAIEEGTVANLIAMSLEGKLKNPASDDVVYPTMENMKIKGIAAPTCVVEITTTLMAQDSTWFDQVDVTKGGAAGKGPGPPEPFTALVDGSKEYPNMADEVDSVEQEVKTKMAFAKMPIPQVFKESFLLDESEFITKVEDIDNASSSESKANDAAGNGGGDIGGNFSGSGSMDDNGEADEFSRTVEVGVTGDLSATYEGDGSGEASPTPSTEDGSRPSSRVTKGSPAKGSGKSSSSSKKSGRGR